MNNDLKKARHALLRLMKPVNDGFKHAIEVVEPEERSAIENVWERFVTLKFNRVVERFKLNAVEFENYLNECFDLEQSCHEAN